jgi:hypothetical protein
MHHGLEARVGCDPRLRRGSREGLLHREGRVQCGPGHQGQRQDARRSADVSRVGLLDRDRDQARGHATGFCPGSAAGGLGHRGRAPNSSSAGSRSARSRRSSGECGSVRTRRSTTGARSYSSAIRTGTVGPCSRAPLTIVKRGIGEDRDTITGCWEWPGSGYEATMTRVK